MNQFELVDYQGKNTLKEIKAAYKAGDEPEQFDFVSALGCNDIKVLEYLIKKSKKLLGTRLFINDIARSGVQATEYMIVFLDTYKGKFDYTLNIIQTMIINSQDDCLAIMINDERFESAVDAYSEEILYFYFRVKTKNLKTAIIGSETLMADYKKQGKLDKDIEDVYKKTRLGVFADLLD